MFFTRPALLFAVVCLFVGGWLTYKTLSSPLGINELSSTQVSYSREAEGGFCAQVYGQCIGHDNSCVTYTDSCVQAKVCARSTFQSLRRARGNPHSNRLSSHQTFFDPSTQLCLLVRRL